MLPTNSAQLILSFDFGMKYIGVAIGHTLTNTARPLTCLINNDHLWQAIEEIILTWKPNLLIVGNPKDLNGKRQPIYFACLQFCRTLRIRSKLKVVQVDEILTTWEAKQTLAINNHDPLTKEQLFKINANAAAILIQHWLNEHKF